MTSAVIDERNEPISLRDSSVNFDPPLLKYQFRIDQINFLIERTLQQASSKHRRKNLCFFLRNFTAVKNAART